MPHPRFPAVHARPAHLCIGFFALVVTGLAQEKPLVERQVDPYPTPEIVAAAMKKAASFYRTHLCFAGGYASKWSRDLATSGDSDRSSPSLIAIEEPGTPVIGLAMLNAYQTTHDPLYLQAAREVSQALLWTQLASGGWETDHDYSLKTASKRHYRRDLDAGDTDRGTRHSHTTLDDDKTQNAMLFLLEFANLPECKDDRALHDALKFSLDSLLAAQAPNGGWPQGFSAPADPALPIMKATIPKEWPKLWPAANYVPFYTTNDGNLRSVANVLTRANQLSPDDRFTQALRKLGDFLILAQCPEPQPGWAQQYNFQMEPVWARKFEPPAISSLETLTTLHTLQDIWLVSGDDKYLAPRASALAWLEKARLPDGQYARFYELNTNKPLYCVKDTYELTYDDTNLPTHYGFKIDDLQRDIDKFKAQIQLSRQEQLQKKSLPETPKAWLSKAKGAAKKAVDALSQQNKEGIWTKENQIDGSLFVKHMKSLTEYYRAASAAGDLFQTISTEK